MERHRPALGIIESLLLCLTQSDADGRIVIHSDGNNIPISGLLTFEVKTPNRSSIKFLLLNPEVHFTSILEEAKSVILAGGTMQPVRLLLLHISYSRFLIL